MASCQELTARPRSTNTIRDYIEYSACRSIWIVAQVIPIPKFNVEVNPFGETMKS